MKRRKVHKGQAARKFNQATARTKRINIPTAPMRGGIRM